MGRLRRAGLITYPSPLLGPLLGELSELLLAEVLPWLDPTDLALFARTGRASRAAVASSGLPRAGTTGGVAFKLKEFLRVRRAAGVGEGERLPVGREDLCTRRCGRVYGGAEVGAGAWLRLGREDVRNRR